MPLPAPDWTTNHTELLRFAHVLVDAGSLTDAKEVLYFFEKPWKWDQEHQIWDGCHRPDTERGDWSWFVRKLDREELRP
jgi:hypothetical protein